MILTVDMGKRREEAHCNEVLGIVILITSGTHLGRMKAAMIVESGTCGRASVRCNRTATILSRFNVGKVHKRRITTLRKATIATFKANRQDNSRDKIATSG